MNRGATIMLFLLTMLATAACGQGTTSEQTNDVSTGSPNSTSLGVDADPQANAFGRQDVETALSVSNGASVVKSVDVAVDCPHVDPNTYFSLIDYIGDEDYEATGRFLSISALQKDPCIKTHISQTSPERNDYYLKIEASWQDMYIDESSPTEFNNIGHISLLIDKKSVEDGHYHIHSCQVAFRATDVDGTQFAYTSSEYAAQPPDWGLPSRYGLQVEFDNQEYISGPGECLVSEDDPNEQELSLFEVL